MKHLKILGLAVVAAAALMALVGAGTASATVMCKNNLNTTTCTEPYALGTELSASLQAGTTAVLETTAGETLITCTGSTINTKLEAQGAATTVKTSVTTMAFTGCNQTVVVLKGGYGELHHIAGTDNGTLTTFGTEVTVNIFGASCVYGSGNGSDVGIVNGGNPGSMSLSTVFPRISGSFICPADARFTGKYVATSPTAGYVAAG